MKEIIYIWLARISLIVLSFDLGSRIWFNCIKAFSEQSVYLSVNIIGVLLSIGLGIGFILFYSVALLPLWYLGFSKNTIKGSV